MSYDCDIELVEDDNITERERHAIEAAIEIRMYFSGSKESFIADSEKVIYLCLNDIINSFRAEDGSFESKAKRNELINKLIGLNFFRKVGSKFLVSRDKFTFDQPCFYNDGWADKRKNEYQRYIHSKEWRHLRKRILLERPACEICGASDCEMHLHHLTYDNFEHERDDDLQVLCLDCHELIHGKRISFH